MFLLVGLLFLASAAPAAAQTAATGERDLSKELVLGVSKDYFPYSHPGKDGKMEGFTIDLTNAVARLMDLKVRWLPLSNSNQQYDGSRRQT